MLRVVQQCAEAGLVSGKTVHCDATLIRADVSWRSMTTEHVEKVLAENPLPEDAPAQGEGGPGGPDESAPATVENAKEAKSPRKPGRKPKAPKRPKKRSKTDPDATLSTNDKRVRMQPCCKQHAAVDDKCGVVVDVEVTTGEANEGKRLLEQVGRVEEATGVKVRTVTADGGYSSSADARTWRRWRSKRSSRRSAKPFDARTPASPSADSSTTRSTAGFVVPQARFSGRASPARTAPSSTAPARATVRFVL